jgi:hypothetical protein
LVEKGKEKIKNLERYKQLIKIKIKIKICRFLKFFGKN